jgi:nitrogen regulatory protein PII
LHNGAINPKKKILNVVKPKNSGICRFRIIMHPIELDNVKKTLEKCGFSNITGAEVRCATTEACLTETYRADHHSIRPETQV